MLTDIILAGIITGRNVYFLKKKRENSFKDIFLYILLILIQSKWSFIVGTNYTMSTKQGIKAKGFMRERFCGFFEFRIGWSMNSLKDS